MIKYVTHNQGSTTNIQPRTRRRLAPQTWLVFEVDMRWSYMLYIYICFCKPPSPRSRFKVDCDIRLTTGVATRDFLKVSRGSFGGACKVFFKLARFGGICPISKALNAQLMVFASTLACAIVLRKPTASCHSCPFCHALAATL